MDNQDAAGKVGRMFDPETTVADAKLRLPGSMKVSAELLALLDPPRRQRDLGTFRGWPILSIVGSGGMATVFHGYDERLRRDVAIKIIRPDRLRDPEMIERFAREARLTAQVRHPNVVVVYSVHDDAMPPFLVMEFLHGGTLLERIRGGPLSEAETIRLAKDIAAGLQAAHDLGLLHRDLKPSNIGFREPNGQIALTDFGLARAICDTDPLTEHGTPLGTPSYMSPEQVQVQKLDVRSDLFSLGTVMYQMATGRLPFQGDSPVTMCHAIAHGPHRPARELRPELSARFSAMLDRLLQKDAQQRYRSANELIEVLESLAAARTSLPEARRRTTFLVAAGVVAVIAGAVWIGATSPWNSAERPAPPGGGPQTAHATAGLEPRPSASTVPPATVETPWRSPPEGRKGIVRATPDGVVSLENPWPVYDWVMVEARFDFQSGTDRFLQLEIVQVDGAPNAGWFAKLASPIGGYDIELNGGQQTGKFALELPSDVGLEGGFQHTVRLFATGSAGSRVQFRGVKFAASPDGDAVHLQPLR
jgi:serine/threonine protein kinase